MPSEMCDGTKASSLQFPQLQYPVNYTLALLSKIDGYKELLKW